MTQHFLKGQNNRFLFENRKVFSDVVKKFQYSAVEGSQFLAPHIFSAISDTLLYKNADVTIDFGSVFKLKLDRRRRLLKFIFSDKLQ